MWLNQPKKLFPCKQCGRRFTEMRFLALHKKNLTTSLVSQKQLSTFTFTTEKFDGHLYYKKFDHVHLYYEKFHL